MGAFHDEFFAPFHTVFRYSVQIHHLQVIVDVNHFGYPSFFVSGGERATRQLSFYAGGLFLLSITCQCPDFLYNFFIYQGRYFL